MLISIIFYTIFYPQLILCMYHINIVKFLQKFVVKMVKKTQLEVN